MAEIDKSLPNEVNPLETEETQQELEIITPGDTAPSEEVNMIKVSDLQPKRSKPGYPQELKNNAGFGYNPAKNK